MAPPLLDSATDPEGLLPRAAIKADIEARKVDSENRIQAILAASEKRIQKLKEATEKKIAEIREKDDIEILRVEKAAEAALEDALKSEAWNKGRDMKQFWAARKQAEKEQKAAKKAAKQDQAGAEKGNVSKRALEEEEKVDALEVVQEAPHRPNKKPKSVDDRPEYTFTHIEIGFGINFSELPDDTIRRVMQELDAYYGGPSTAERYQDSYDRVRKITHPPPERLHPIEKSDLFTTMLPYHFIYIPGSVIPVSQTAVPLLKAKLYKFDLEVRADTDAWYLVIGKGWGQADGRGLHYEMSGEAAYDWMDGRTFNGTPLKMTLYTPGHHWTRSTAEGLPRGYAPTADYGDD